MPIYIGAPDVDRLVPTPAALIRAAAFNSTADLAAHLERVGGDEKLYEQYLAWKRQPEEQWSEVRRARAAAAWGVRAWGSGVGFCFLRGCAWGV